MQQTFDLRLATLAADYRNGKTTPRALLAEIRQRAQALNPEFRRTVGPSLPDRARTAGFRAETPEAPAIPRG